MAFGQRVGAPVLVPDDGERFAPVALPGEQPVPQAVRDGGPSRSARFQPGGRLGLGLVLAQAVEVERPVGGVDGDAVALVGGLVEVRPVGVVRRADRPHDVQVVGAGEVPVAGVVGGDGHDRPGAVPHEDVVGHEDGDPLSVDGVRPVQP